MPTILARDDEGRVVDWQTPRPPTEPHDHDQYATKSDLDALTRRVAALEPKGKPRRTEKQRWEP